MVAAPVLFVVGLALLAASLTVGIRALFVLAVAALGLSLVAFVGTPVVAMFRSQSAEERAERRR
jgi:hypothetical protein